MWKQVAYPYLALKCSWTHAGLSRRKSGDRYPLKPPDFYALVSLVVEVLFCKQGVEVRFLPGAPVFSPCGEMVSFVVWGHVAGVRFPPPRPVVLAFIDGVEKDKLSITNFGGLV